MKTGILSLGKQTIIYGLGDALYKAVAFLLLPVYLKCLSPSEYGTLESLMVTRGLAVTLVAMGLSNAVFRFYYRSRDENERKTILSTIFFISLVAQLILPFLFLWKNELISKLVLKSPEFGFFFAIVAVNVFLISFRGIPLSLFRAQNRALAYTTLNLAVSLITLGMNIFFVAYMQKGVLGVLLGNICGGIVGLIIVFPAIVREIRFTFDRLFVRKILIYAVPLGLAVLPATIIFMADRYFILRLASMHDLGIYALAYKMGIILKVFVIMPFMLAWGPFVFSKEREDNAKYIYSTITKYFVMISLIFVVFISIMQIDIIKLLTKNPDYYGATKIVPLICYAIFFYGFSNVVRGVGIRITGKTYYTTAIMIIGMCVNLVMNYILIKSFGVVGAAYALLITFIIVFILSYIVSNRLYIINYELVKIFTLIIVSIIPIVISQVLDTLEQQYGIFIRMFLVMLLPVCMYYLGLSKDERDKAILKLFVLRKKFIVATS